MHNIRKRIAVGLGLICSAAWVVAAPVPGPEKLLPNDTLAVLAVPNWAKACGAFDQSPGNQLWEDPAIKPFKDKFLAKLKSDVIEPLQKELGIKFSDYSELAQGQLTIAITQSGWEGKPKQKPGFLVLLDTQDKSAQLKSHLAEVKKKWADSGKQLRSEKIRDVDFTTFMFSSDEFSKALDKAFPDPNEGYETKTPPKQKKKPTQMEWIVGQSDSLLVMSSSSQEIEKVLIRQSGGAAPSLSEQSLYSASYGPMFRDTLGYAWVNLKAIMDATTKAAQTAENNPGRRSGMNPEKVFTTLGLTGLESMSINMNNTPDGATVNMQVRVPEGARRGLFKILSFENKDANPPSFVPADAVKFSRFRLDLQKTFAGVEAMVSQFDPNYGNILKTMIDLAGKDKDQNFDLRQQLIGNLGDDIISYQKNPRKQTLEDLNSPPTLFLISSPKPEQLASAIKSVTSLLPQSMTSSPKLKDREFLGRKVYTLGLPNMGGPAPGGKPKENPSLHYSASGGYVVLSTDVAMLEEYLRGNTAKALAETPGLGEAAQKVGGMNTGMFGYENQRETTRAALETLKKESGTIANLLTGSAFADRLGLDETGNKFKDWVDFSLLPPFDQIAKYFHISVWSGSITPEGFNFKVYAPVSPQVKK